MYIIFIILNFIFFKKKYIYNLENITIKENYNNIDIFISQLTNNIEDIWGKNELIFKNKNTYIRYTDNNNTRSYINLTSKIILIETIIQKNPKKYIKNEMLNLILLKNLYNKSIYEEKYKLNNIPFLYGKILDNNGYPIQIKEEALNYINHILKNKLLYRLSSNNKKIFFFKIKLNNNYIIKKKEYYINLVKKYSIKYNIDKYLILSIINIESNFNPYAVSKSGAIGLMQIIKDKSGLDVFKYKKKIGYPTVKYLLNPENNIDTGVLYLWILKNKYFVNIKDEDSLRYIIISTYNGGINNVLKIFSFNYSDSINIINKISSKQVYNLIYKNHCIDEIKNYLKKVNDLYLLYKSNN